MTMMDGVDWDQETKWSSIWSYGHMAIQPYGYIVSEMDNMGGFGSSNTDVAIW